MVSLIALSVVLLSAHFGRAEAEENCNQEISLETVAALTDLGPEGDGEESVAQDDAVSEVGAAASERDSELSSLDTPVPTAWAEAQGRECRRRRGRITCDGPRRVPLPEGDAAALALRLGFGDRQTAHQLLVRGPDDTWIDAAGPASEDALYWPIDGGRMWRGFGRVRRRAGVRHRLHKGIDIGASEGTPFRAIASGIVVYSDNGVSGYGNLTMVVHGDGSVAFYAHARANYLFPGQRVVRGQILGEVGHTGLARGDHLHLELRIGGRPVNPIRRFDQPILGR
ncbi:MAG: M23 family metallopeptidase [Myxococcota bacterium]